MAFCRNCGKQLMEGSRFCSHCGTQEVVEQSNNNYESKQEWGEKTIKCPSCGTVLQSFTAICPKCGHEVAANIIVRDVKTALQAKAVCLLSGHDWFGCKCKRCGATRDQGHQFQPVEGKMGTCVKECTVCGETKEEHHYQLIEGKCEQKCLICDEIEEISHDWKGAKCKRCGELEDVWYVKSWAVILLLILFFPVGFYLMWKYQPWHKYIKIGITVVISVFCLIAIISPGGRSNPEPSNELIMPASARQYVGENYKTVISQLKDIGFKNIKTEKLEDLITGWLTKDGEIDQISINGDSKFSDGDKFSKDAKITVIYHTFKEQPSNISESASSDEVSSKPVEQTSKPTTQSSTVINKSRYEKGYRVRLQDYDIYFLIDEDNKTISIFDTTAPTLPFDAYTSSYTGDLNNGIDFNWDGLQMHAHYHYWNQDSTLIVTDITGNENKAIKIDVDTAASYIKK